MRRAVAALAIISTIAIAAAPPSEAAWTALTASPNKTVATASLVAPTGLATAIGTCVKNTSVSVRLNWTATVSTAADGYEVLRSTTSGGPYTLVGTVTPRTTITFTDTTTGFLTTYHYVLRSKRNAWTSPASAQVSITTLSLLCK